MLRNDPHGRMGTYDTSKLPRKNIQERKLAAIQAMHADVAPDYGKRGNLSPAEIAERIRELAPVCRSAKWRDAVERYASFVTAESGDNGERLNWAYSQGSVYFGYEVF